MDVDAPAARVKRLKLSPSMLRASSLSSNSDSSSDAGPATPPAQSGTYEVACPYVADEWPEHIPTSGASAGFFTLRLHLCAVTARLWGRFAFGPLTGVLRTVGALPTAHGEPVPFEWRGYAAAGADAHASAKPEPVIDEDCTGSITLLPDGRVAGVLDGGLLEIGKARFVGRMSEKARALGGADVHAWKAEWRCVAREVYGERADTEDDGDNSAPSSPHVVTRGYLALHERAAGDSVDNVDSDDGSFAGGDAGRPDAAEYTWDQDDLGL
jgi:hypothetical protein